VDIVPLSREVQRPERAVPEPVFRLANFDNITVDAEANGSLAEGDQTTTDRWIRSWSTGPINAEQCQASTAPSLGWPEIDHDLLNTPLLTFEIDGASLLAGFQKLLERDELPFTVAEFDLCFVNVDALIERSEEDLA